MLRKYLFLSRLPNFVWQHCFANVFEQMTTIICQLCLNGLFQRQIFIKLARKYKASYYLQIFYQTFCNAPNVEGQQEFETDA